MDDLTCSVTVDIAVKELVGSLCRQCLIANHRIQIHRSTGVSESSGMGTYLLRIFDPSKLFRGRNDIILCI